MKVSPINNYQAGNLSKNANFKGQFIMNDPLYIHNLTASAEELNVFRNTLKKIGTINDNLRFSLEADKEWYRTLKFGVWGKNYTWSYKLFKQTGDDESTKEQIGNTIYTENFEPGEDGYSVTANKDCKIVEPSELLEEISLRLKKFYNRQKIFGMFNSTNTDKEDLRKEIEELTIHRRIGVEKWLDSLKQAD